MRKLRIHKLIQRKGVAIIMKKMIFPIINEFELSLPYYIQGVGCDYEQERIRRPYGFPLYQWIQTRHGIGELILDNVTYRVGENQGMLLYPDEPHEYYAISEHWVVDWIIFRSPYIGSFFEQTMRMESSGVYYISQPRSCADKITQIYEIERTNSPVKSVESSRLVYEVLMDIMKFSSIKMDHSITHHYNRLKPLFLYIDENYDKQISLSELAQIIGVTPQHLCNIFKNATTYSVVEYINMTRIKKSKELMVQDKSLQIKQIASLVGFQDVSYFCATFRKMVNMSPTEFKEQEF
jgi:AraC-like DNA-binding protein